VPQFKICNLHSAICICHSSLTLRVGFSILTRSVSEDVRQLQITNLKLSDYRFSEITAPRRLPRPRGFPRPGK
jgi:hypothetical protein